MRHLGIILALSVLTTVGLTYSTDKPKAQNGPLAFRTIEQSASSAEKENKNMVIKDEATWKAVWAETHANMTPVPDLPEVDFKTKMVIAAFMGEKPTGGFSIEIERIIRAEKKIIAFIVENSPHSACMVTKALTAPYHFVEVERFESEVAFEEREGINRCN